MAVVFLSACTGGNSTSKSVEPTEDTSGGQTISTVQFELQQQGEINKGGSLNIPAAFNQLASDDAIYLSVLSEDIENGKLTVEPKSALLYPTNGRASVVLSLTDNGLNRSTNINVELTTSNGLVINEIVNLTLGE